MRGGLCGGGAVGVGGCVCEQGAEPATIGMVDGRAVVGLSEPQLHTLAKARHGVVKASRRDLSAVMCQVRAVRLHLGWLRCCSEAGSRKRPDVTICLVPHATR